MKYQDKYVGSQEEIYDLLKDLPRKFMQNSVEVESEKVTIPSDKELTYKLKFEEDEYDGAFAVKVTWVNAEELEEKEEEEMEEEE